jgi:hypothetical protein
MFDELEEREEEKREVGFYVRASSTLVENGPLAWTL